MRTISRDVCGLPIVPLALACQAALAQEQGPGREPETLPANIEHIIVTGTRITRSDYESASPIVTVLPELFEFVGSPTVEAALNQLPQLVPHGTSTSNNPGRAGQAHLNLRGLGPTATLVLLDGRRITPANGAGVVDANLIPPTLIEQVEIVSGGASAVYGSDAVAGVVNFRLRESFAGLEVGGRYGQTDRGDGEQWDVHVTAGTRFASGRGSVYGFAGRSERQLVTQGDRTFSRYALTYVGPGNGTLGPGNAFIAGGNVIIEEGVAVLPTSGANAIRRDTFDQLFASYGETSPFQSAFGFNEDGTLFTLGNGTPGSVANFRGVRDPVLFNGRSFGYNYAPPNALQLPLERTSAFGRLTFALTDSLRLYADGLYGDYSVSQQLAATPLAQVFMPRGNSHVPADLAFLLDSRPNPDAPFQWFKRLSEVGPRIVDSEYDVHQATIGLDGRLSENWRFDAYAQYGENRRSDRTSGNVLRSRIEELAFAADAGFAVCGGFDIFGLGSISPECAAYVTANAGDEVRLEQFIAEFSVEGALANLPAGELRTAFGALHKRDRFRYTADPLASRILPDGRPDLGGFGGARDDVRGNDYNTDLYVEALVPLLSDRPGVKLLEVGLGYRRSEYEQAGGGDAWKVELMYRPVDPLRIRGSFQNAIRAPSINELYTPQLSNILDLGAARDPCEFTSTTRAGPDAAAAEALCIAQGVPADLLPTLRHPFNTAQGFVGGNPELKPEEAESWTVGFVWSPPRSDSRWGQMQASIDWYRIELERAIGSVSLPVMVALCFDPRVNPDLSVDQPWCTFFARNADTGQIEDARVISRNLGVIETSGVDMQLDWSLPAGPGTLGVNWLVSWLDSFDRNAGANAPMEVLAGSAGASNNLLGGALPEWKSLLSLSYSRKGMTFGARQRYVAAMDDAFDPAFRIPSRTYIDLFGSYGFGPGLLDGLRLGFGVENLTDRSPPIFPDSTGATNTDPQQYDVLGRRYFATLSYRF